MNYLPGDNRWLDVVKSFERTAYRLEQQPVYLDDVHNGLLDDWLAGITRPPGPNDWSRFIADKVAGGAVVERIRVVENPLNPYQQWIKWYSQKNIDAGERHLYIERGEAAWGKIPYNADFWLLDDTTVVWFWFQSDGAPKSVHVTSDPDQVRMATKAWRIARELVTDTKATV